jgi:predicted phage tail protein
MMRPVVFLTPPWMPTIGIAGTGLTSLTVNCTPPLGTGGSPITSYKATSSSTNPALPVLTATGTACPLTVTGVTVGQPYTFTVQAINAYGTSQPSKPSNTVVAGPPLPPTGVTIGISLAPSLRIFLNWTNTLQPGTGMTIQRATNSAFTTGLTTFTIPVSTSYTDTTAVANTVYFYRMHSIVGATVSAWSPTVSMSTAAPAVPQWVSLVPTATSVALTWTEAQTSGTNNWGGFEIWWSTDPTFATATAVVFLGPAPPFTYTATFGIASGQTYYFQMRARNGSSNSAVFNTVTHVTTP